MAKRVQDVTFDPDYCVAPWTTLVSWYTERGAAQWTLMVLMAQNYGITRDELHGFMFGEPLMVELAAKLEEMTGVSRSFWLTRDVQYRRGLEEGKTDASGESPVSREEWSTQRVHFEERIAELEGIIERAGERAASRTERLGKMTVAAVEQGFWRSQVRGLWDEGRLVKEGKKRVRVEFTRAVFDEMQRMMRQ